MEYMFKTSTQMKPYNCKKWFIDDKYISPITIEADSVEEALKLWHEEVLDNYCVTITSHAMKTKQPMYRDYKDGTTKQVGWVITGRTEFNDDYKKWVKQYIELWVEIITIIDTNFNERINYVTL